MRYFAVLGADTHNFLDVLTVLYKRQNVAKCEICDRVSILWVSADEHDTEVKTRLLLPVVII